MPAAPRTPRRSAPPARAAAATTAVTAADGPLGLQAISPIRGQADQRQQSRSNSIAAGPAPEATITVWAWAPQTKDIVAAFEKKRSKVTATKLQNAVRAGRLKDP